METPLLMLMKDYCERQSLEIKQCCFVFKNKIIQGVETPYFYEMKAGDEIKAYRRSNQQVEDRDHINNLNQIFLDKHSFSQEDYEKNVCELICWG